MSSLVKQMCLLKCRINVDSVAGNISIVDMDDENVESVIDSVSEAFDIIGIDIVPKVVVPEPEPPVITEESLEFEKLKFNDKEVQEQANKLLRTSYWAMYSSNASSRDICQYLMSANVEIAMKYGTKVPTDVCVGDIVDCNYGSHVNGEISGGHVHSIVCDIDDNGMVYAVPITKSILEGDGTRYLAFKANFDVEYTNPKYTGGTVLLKMGKYIHQQRFGEVVGHALPDFFVKVLNALPTAVDFLSKYTNYESKLAEKLGDVENDDDMLSFDAATEQQEGDKEEFLPEKEVTESADQDTFGEEENNSQCSSYKNVSEVSVEATDGSNAQKIPTEYYLSDMFADALNSLDYDNKTLGTNVDEFLDAIGLSKDNIIKQAFYGSTVVKRVNYDSIIIYVHDLSPNFSEEKIKAILKKSFNEWLLKYPEIREKYPRISIMALLKIFAKRM